MTDTTHHSTASFGIGSLLAAPADPWTYRSLAYLVLAAPLGLAYFVVLVTGVALSLGLAITLLGPVVFVLTLVVILALTWVDTALTSGVLEAETVVDFPASDQGLVEFLRALVLGRDTWLGACYLVWKAILGFLAFVGLVVALSVALSLVLVPAFYTEYTVVATYPIDSLERALAAGVGGLVVAYLALVVVNLLGHLSVVIVESLFPAGDEGVYCNE